MAVVVFVTSLLLVTRLVDAGTYCYGDGPKGPANWSKLYSSCAAKHQSPVEMKENRVIEVDLGNLTFQGFFKKDRPSNKKWLLSNYGLSIDLQLGGGYYIGGGGVPGKLRTYLVNFHWGRVNGRGSEHKLDGKFYDGEVQLSGFDFKTLYTERFATMIKVVEKDNPRLDVLIDAVRKVKFKNDYVQFSAMESLADLLSPDLGNFYRYQGHLPWPPCSLKSIWTVWRTPLEMGRAQMEVFRSLYNKQKGSADGIHIADNYRPLQPLNNRTILYNPQHNYRSQVEASV